MSFFDNLEQETASELQWTLGLTFEEVKQKYDGDVVIEREDGDPKRLDANFDPKRINLTIVKGKTVSAEFS